MLPHVVRFNSNGTNPYSDIHPDAEGLARRISQLLKLASIPGTLSEHGIPREILPRLADRASKQWTAQFNPRRVSEGICWGYTSRHFEP